MTGCPRFPQTPLAVPLSWLYGVLAPHFLLLIRICVLLFWCSVSAGSFLLYPFLLSQRPRPSASDRLSILYPFPIPPHHLLPLLPPSDLLSLFPVPWLLSVIYMGSPLHRRRRPLHVTSLMDTARVHMPPHCLRAP